MVTDEARKRLSISNCSRDYADMSDCMDQLRITEGEFYRQFSSEFEICKRKFPDEDFYSITIKGHHGKFATFGLNKCVTFGPAATDWTIKLIKRRQFMIQCFEIVARKVAAVISKRLEDNVPVPVSMSAPLSPCLKLIQGSACCGDSLWRRRSESI